MPIKFFAFSILLVPFFVVGSCLLGGADLEKKNDLIFPVKDSQGYEGFVNQKSFVKHGIDSSQFLRINDIVKAAITKKAFPGCQVFVSYKGDILFNNSYGSPTYESNTLIDNDFIYDIASVTKIVGATLALMRLETMGKFSVDKKLVDYIPEVTRGTPYGDINIREMLAHQSGLVAWIPFYKKTLVNNQLSESIYSLTKDEEHSLQVANKCWISKNYFDTILARITQAPLGKSEYLYSDLGYYFLKRIIEKQSGLSLDVFLKKEFYEPLGLKTVGYNPTLYYDLSKITPTENDLVFRKQLIHGYVHDPGAAMLGGVGGHAGLFSNATELGVIMQLLLNKGEMNGKRYIDAKVVEEYTKTQFPGNRRGIGFDKPPLNGHGGGVTSEVSSSSFGHTGFTGTIVWADPKEDLVYVFLSNRVYPSAENWKIVSMNVRTEIQKVIYKTILSRKK